MLASSRARILACIVVSMTLGGCNRGAAPAADRPAEPAPTAAGVPSNADESQYPTIVVLGDSLSAGYGLEELQSFPALLQAKLRQDGYKWKVVNAGVSGDTSAAGLQRVDWALGRGDVRIMILALGANDGLRGLPVSEMKKNLAGIIEAAQAKGVAILLAGMEAPPNFGPEYTVSFRQVFRDLASQYKVAFLPFLLDKVAGESSLNQSDGIHPNIEGTAIVAETVWNALKPMVARSQSTS